MKKYVWRRHGLSVRPKIAFKPSCGDSALVGRGVASAKCKKEKSASVAGYFRVQKDSMDAKGKSVTNGPLIVRRTRAIIARGSQILFCHHDDMEYMFFPGGKLHVDETAPLGLAREIEEETGRKGLVGEFVGAVEHRYFDVKRQEDTLEINFVFTFAFEGGEPETVESKESNLNFRWVNISYLPSLKMFPAGMFQLLSIWFNSKGKSYVAFHTVPEDDA